MFPTNPNDIGLVVHYYPRKGASHARPCPALVTWAHGEEFPDWDAGERLDLSIHLPGLPPPVAFEVGDFVPVEWFTGLAFRAAVPHIDKAAVGSPCWQLKPAGL